MTADFDSLREDFARTFEAIERQTAAQTRFAELVTDDNGRQWQAIADLRDDLHALANRVESLTQAVMADPCEVTEAVIRREFTEDDAA